MEAADLLRLLVFGVVVVERGDLATIKNAHPIISVIVNHSDKSMHLSLRKLALEKRAEFAEIASDSMRLPIENGALINTLDLINFNGYLFRPLELKRLFIDFQNTRVDCDGFGRKNR